MGLFRISESVRAYAYLILSLQATARKYGECTHCQESLSEGIKHYQDTLSYALGKVDYSMGGVYMLPSYMNLNIRSGTTGYNNEIIVSDSGFCLGKEEYGQCFSTEP